GQVVGCGYTDDGHWHAFSWAQLGGIVDLGTLGGTYSCAVAVTRRGQVVGWSTKGLDVRRHAFSWTQSGGMVDLGTLGGVDSEASAVSDSGQAVGWSDTADGDQHAF